MPYRLPSDPVMTLLTLARTTLGHALVHRHTGGDRDRGRSPGRGQRGVPTAGETTWASYRLSMCTWRVRGFGAEIAMDALALMLAAIDHLFRDGLLTLGVPATCILVETLLERGDDGDVVEAEAATAVGGRASRRRR